MDIVSMTDYGTNNKKNNKKPPLVILTGPTAVGKTALSIELAKEIDGEIISADSMQVYRLLDIGTAKIKREEMEGVPHHLIDVLSPMEEFNVYTFQQMAKAAIEEIYERGKIPIVVGGTGFYIQALLYDVNFEETEVSAYREELTAFWKSHGAHALHERLREIDPDSYASIHENNVKRVIRALEFYHDTGTPISKHNEEQRQKESPYNFAYFVLNDDRKKLYQRIELRINEMIEEGLIHEVKEALELGCTPDMVSMQGLGYKELIPYINGECSLEDALYILKRDTRHFAKRQLTWFRREREVIWVNKDELTTLEHQLDYLLAILDERNITD